MEITGGFGGIWEGILSGGGVGVWDGISLITSVQPLKATNDAGDC
jgi:hypothetical protein